MQILRSAVLKTRRFLKGLSKRWLVLLFVSQFVFLIYTEFLHHYVVISQCSWSWPSRRSVPGEDQSEYKRVLLIADTHLLGSRLGHWLDRMRREAQMHTSYMAAVRWLRPDWVIFLGDLFDEGKWCGREEFDEYVRRFDALFPGEEEGFPPRLVVAGNHDIGFHYSVQRHLLSRFSSAFNASGVRMVSLSYGIHLVLVNSVAMQGDSCFMCSTANSQLSTIAGDFKCAETSDCSPSTIQLEKYSRPILVQHYPLFRQSDSACGNSPHTAPSSVKRVKFRPGWDCLTVNASRQLLGGLKPRLILSGHTHHYCLTQHQWRTQTGDMRVTEYSVPSFNWRNKPNPAFLMLDVNSTDYRVRLCAMAVETTVFALYILDILLLLFLLTAPLCCRFLL